MASNAIALSVAKSGMAQSRSHRENEKYVVAAYYFGNYHQDSRNDVAHGKGWTEWQLVKDARPRFAGHKQPKVPLWGYGDESDPKVFEQKIRAAAHASISAFIFDWYWYNDGPFLQGALEGVIYARPTAQRLSLPSCGRIMTGSICILRS
ncbi:glycoside hydrolase family 99-like domain-containing protein [Tunturiibacter empetritectus]|uniref:glycoside hydrolase family 99-like domain-containing protein n=1 Tax=Tunturiibacter empetritectus TaxID=3069691 RepID=UPI003D9B6715